MSRNAMVAALLLMPFVAGASAQDSKEEAAPDAANLAQQIQNPLASLVSLPLQFNFNEGVGPYDRRMFNLNVQPVIPFPGESWNIITRTIMPVNSVPVGATDSVFGIGDTTLSIFMSPAGSGSVTWGVGPIFSVPTASNPEVLGSDKLSIGPTGVLFASVGKWTMGAVASNVWSVAGNSDRDDVNFGLVQWFLNYNIGNGWALGTAPIITVNWKAESGNQWTIPWGVQVSKVTHFGSRPVNLLLGYYKNTTHPEGGADSQVRFQLNLLFPQKP